MSKAHLTAAQKRALLVSRHSRAANRHYIDGNDGIRRVTFSALERKGIGNIRFYPDDGRTIRDAGWRFWLTDTGEIARAEVISSMDQS